ncbi:MAG TPA: phenylalanine--tRNA ligase subunit alpha, partial [Planctomycetaceae bacterium]|nr:phenylalanine--tRNA ligase subunit alpha [Planctomycetaceae bacterium]
MSGELREIREQFLADLARAKTPQDVEDVRIRYLGRRGRITTLARRTDFSRMSPEGRREFGKQLNELKALAKRKVAE